MRLLLDTHSLIWFFSGHPNLSATARQLMEDTTQQKLISLASVWEMGIKQSKGKLTLSLPLEDYIKEKIKLEDFELLPIQLNHLGVISTLPFHHNDPFDRLLIAQAMTENIPILSRDSAFNNYHLNRIWD
jgi:PIN domain nuclease of toxin-antitoxin system